MYGNSVGVCCVRMVCIRETEKTKERRKRGHRKTHATAKDNA